MNPSEAVAKAYPGTDPFLLFKWERAYKHFFDVNESGEIDLADNYLIKKHIKDIYGAESAQWKMAKTGLDALWKELIGVADTNKDKKISIIEWIKVFQGHDPKNIAPWYLDYVTFMFKLFDVSEDNKLDLGEYADAMLVYQHPESEAHAAFKTAADAKGQPQKAIDFPQFHKLWDDYFYSTDKSTPGNHLFGIISES